MSRLTVRGHRVVFPDGVRAAAIHIDAGRIVAVRRHAEIPAGPVIDAGDLVVLPGLVDTHVHVNEPGRTDWEGFDTATRAAAAGGVTTIVDMPLNSIPATTSAGAFEAKLAAASGACHVDVGFWGGVVPGNTSDLEGLARGGVLGFKCFLSPSGVAEFAHVSEADLREAAPVLARLGLPLLVHAELPRELREADPAADPRDYRTWLNTRPPEAEEAAIDLLIALAREYGAHVHVVHLASAGALRALQEARANGIGITAETCPHYLSFCAEEVPRGATPFKCAPPIRGREHREALWDALARRDIDLVATDHSPAPPAMKHLDDGDFLEAWGGIASLQLGLAAVWTQAFARGFDLCQLSRWLSAAPARLAGLSQKGTIAEGKDADLVFWDPDAEWLVDPGALCHRHPVTPYAGLRLRGRVHRTILRGATVHADGALASPGGGRLLLR